MSAPQALLGDAVARDLSVITLVQSASLILRLAALLGFAHTVGSLVIVGHLPWTILIGSGVLMGLPVAASTASEGLVAAAETKAANIVLDWFLRFAAQAPVAEVQAMDSGDLANRLSRQPGAAARAMVSVKIGKWMSPIGACAALGLMAVLSWQAAIILLLTMPIMVMFFVLIGRLTKAKALAQEATLQELSGAFAEKVRCLPTIMACGASNAQATDLGRLLNDYRKWSSELLRVAFLNSAVLDFFSSLSIAMLAIFLGLGHLGLVSFPGLSGLSLSASLGVLVLAPEVFQPFRRFSELYHQAAEGDEALRSLEPFADSTIKEDTRLPLGRLGTRGVVLANQAVIDDCDLPATGLVAVTGPSGSGKTMLLKTLAGVQAPLKGQVFRANRHAAWVDIDAWLPTCTNDPDQRTLFQKLRLTDDPRFQECDDLSSAAHGDVSGGQRVRLILAHALMRDETTLFADEPTAKLDHKSAEAVRDTLVEAASKRLVIVATHDPVLARRAHLCLRLQVREGVPA
ncbi:MAG: ATP-binding cassette domain-containing protein [Pseudomonadota bacterium]